MPRGKNFRKKKSITNFLAYVLASFRVINSPQKSLGLTKMRVIRCHSPDENARKFRAPVFVTNMSKLTRKGAAAAAAATTTMDDDDAFDHQHNSSTERGGAEGERNSNSKVYGKRKGNKKKMDKLYSSFKSNLTKKSTHSGGGGEEGGGGGENGTVEKEDENGEENSVDPRDLGDGLRRVEFPSSAKASDGYVFYVSPSYFLQSRHWGLEYRTGNEFISDV